VTPATPQRFSFWARDPLAVELEEQTAYLVRECKTDRLLLSSHAPVDPAHGGAERQHGRRLVVGGIGSS
jgi:hypothetical protein